MAKNTKQIASVQQRFGKLNELPKQLETAKFGWAYDANRLFIGNPEHPTLEERYNSNTFPYGNVEILTEFSDLTGYIKYSPWMNGRKVHYPFSVIGTVENPVVSKDSSIIVNGIEIKFDGNVYITDYDYLVLRYIWTSGRDLDTDTRFTNLTNFSEINDKGVGFGYTYEGKKYGGQYILPTGSSVADSFLSSLGDNTGHASPENPQEENILFSRNNLITAENYDNLPENINIELSGTWFSQVGNNVKIEIYAYKGGTMTSQGYRYYNVGGEQLYFIDEDGNTVDHLYIDVDNLSDTLHVYNTLGYVNINKETGYTTISTSQDGGEQSLETPLETILRIINGSDVNIVAKNNMNRIQLITTDDELVLQSGVNIDGINTLEALGFTEQAVTLVAPTKRSLQEILDDRYCIKSFDVKGDGITDDGKQINKVLEILYNYNRSDTKELFFPADTYLVNGVSLNLFSNTHLKGEGIDRTIIKTKENNKPLLITTDDLSRDADNTFYCKDADGNWTTYPHNILIEDMTFDISKGQATSLLKLGHSNNITFRNCKFILNSSSSFVSTLSNCILNNIVFDNVIFEGNNSSVIGININGELDNLLITECLFKDVSNNVISLNGNSNLIKNGIIANNRFTNCSSLSHTLITANNNTKYISVVKSLVDDNVINEVDGFKVLSSQSDLNYCDTPIKSTDTNKYLRFHFYQSIYDYVQALYNRYGKLAFEIISPNTDEEATNYLKLIQGTSSNNNTLSLNATNQVGNVEINMGHYADLELGKDNIEIKDWKTGYNYKALEVVYYNNAMYRCIITHTSENNFDNSKWIQITSTDINTWSEGFNYSLNDFVSYQNKIYYCKEAHRATYEFDEEKWSFVANDNPKIVLHKALDINNNLIKNDSGTDIIFQVKSGGALKIDDSLADKPYEDTIGNKENAIPNVKFVENVAKSKYKEKLTSETINEQIGLSESSEFEIVTFDREKYGNDVSLKEVSINVRQLFIPIGEQINAFEPNKCSYLDWTNKFNLTTPYEYDVDEVVAVDDTNYNRKYYKCLTAHLACISEATLYENFIQELNDGYWQEIQPTPYYIMYTSYDYSSIQWYKGDVVRIIEQNSNEQVIKFYICTTDHTSSILDDEQMSFNNDFYEGYWKEIIIDASQKTNAMNVSNYNFAFDNEDDTVVLTNYIGGDANVTLPELMEVIKTVPDLKYIAITSEDNNKEAEPKKWLFNINDVDIVKRNTNGYNYGYWQSNYNYNIGDIVNFNYSNFVCKESHTSGSSQIDLHNASLWKKMNESGFDYVFHFERSLLEKDADNNFVEEPYQFSHNFVNHTLKIALYDELGNDLTLLNNDNEKLFEVNNWEEYHTYYVGEYFKYNNKTYIVKVSYTSTPNDWNSSLPDYRDVSNFINEIVSMDWNIETQYYEHQYIRFNSNTYQALQDFISTRTIEEDIEKGYLKMIPNHYIQISTSGELLVTVKYERE